MLHLACMLHSMLGSLFLEQTMLTVHYLRDEPASFHCFIQLWFASQV